MSDSVAGPDEVNVADWFVSLPSEPTDAPWQWLTPQAARDVSRLTGYFRSLFDFRGDWFSASRDRPEYLTAFRERVLAVGGTSDPVYVLHREFKPYSAVFTTVGGFLDCWPRLHLVEDRLGFVILPLDLGYWLQIAGTGTAHIARRTA